MKTQTDKQTVTKTRFDNLGLMHVCPSLWRFVDLSDGGEACVGPYYKTKLEALSDLHRYATEVFGTSV